MKKVEIGDPLFMVTGTGISTGIERYRVSELYPNGVIKIIRMRKSYAERDEYRLSECQTMIIDGGRNSFSTLYRLKEDAVAAVKAKINLYILQTEDKIAEARDKIKMIEAI